MKKRARWYRKWMAGCVKNESGVTGEEVVWSWVRCERMGPKFTRDARTPFGRVSFGARAICLAVVVDDGVGSGTKPMEGEWEVVRLSRNFIFRKGVLAYGAIWKAVLDRMSFLENRVKGQRLRWWSKAKANVECLSAFDLRSRYEGVAKLVERPFGPSNWQTDIETHLASHDRLKAKAAAIRDEVRRGIV